MKLWIARNKDGSLALFSYKPWKIRYDTFDKLRGDFIELDKKLYPEVTFDNSPIEVELVIKKQDENRD